MDRFVVLRAQFGALLLLLMVSSCSSFKNLPMKTLLQLQKTINVTKQSSTNTTLAHEACDHWGALLEDKDFHFHQAIAHYGYVLKLRDVMSKQNLEEAVLGRGRALQRLLQYDQGRNQFLELAGSETAIVADIRV